MNLLMLSGDPSVAQGRWSVFRSMLSEYARYWQRIDIICPSGAGATNRVLENKVFVHPVSPLGPRLSRLTRPRLVYRRGRELGAQTRYALITSHDYGFYLNNGLAASALSRRLGVPWVSELHHVDGHPIASTLADRLRFRLARRYVRWATPRASAFRVVNRKEMPRLLRGWGVPDGKIKVLYAMYIDHDLFRPVNVRKEYDLLLCGHLVRNKGPLLFLEGLRIIAQQYPNVQAAVVGQGPMERRMRAVIAAWGLEQNVVFLGWLPTQADLARIYNASRMLVCTSYAEGGPRVAVEAMACGVPVVTTPVGLMSEIVVHDENGLLFHWDAEDLATCALHLLADPAEQRRIGCAGRETVQPFEYHRKIRELAEGYQQLIREAAVEEASE
nr:glycosyltransferase family 1 protein [Anaerolineae bacterium]